MRGRLSIIGSATNAYHFIYSTDHRQVSLDRTDKAYPSENEFAVEISKERRASISIQLIFRLAEGETVKVDFQIIYSDYTSCVLFWTWSLGYQVWVEASYLKNQRKVPRVCELLYHLLTDNQKYVVYNQRNCIITNRKKSSEKKQLQN
ncbi:hypothetical protein V5799_032231 [Amblyomma americanum]|uniref:Uncharacterized protein n=1 Tax=Amblyomma americanum TaxID=6943 RepID=A0AAQ4DRS6_AMBAM